MATNCNNCGCDVCDEECTNPLYAPIKECVPEMTKPSFTLGLDCDRRKRKIANKVKSLLTSDGDTVRFRDGSEEDRIALALVQEAYSSGIVGVNGSGELQVTTPAKDGIDYWLGFVNNVLGFHEAPDNSNSFLASTVEERSCGSLALVICDSSGRAKLAKFKGCEQASGVVPLGIDADGEISCITTEEEEIVEEVQSTCKAGFSLPYFLAAPALVVDKWPGVSYPYSDGNVGGGGGSFNIPPSFPDISKITRLILYVESGSFHRISGNYRDLYVNVNNERVHYDNGAVDQIGTSAGAGTGGSSTEATATHNGGAAATWSLNSNVSSDYKWKLRIYVKGAYYDHCEYGHSEEPV